MNRLRLLLTIIMLLTLAGCGTLPATESPTAAPPTAAPAQTPRVTLAAEPTAPPKATSTPTAAPATTVEPTAAPDSEVPIATLTAELSATVVASMPPTSTPAPGNAAFPGIEGVNAQPLKAPEGWPPLWAVSSHGLSVDPAQGHFVAVYTRDGKGWRELDRFALSNDDYLDPGSLTQVDVDPRYIWLEAQGGAGAHSGCYDLLRFDGRRLHDEASSCSSSPGAGGLEDLNGDGVPEVLLDATDHYVFCYACGVRLVNYTVLRWDGQKMVEMTLEPLPGSETSELTRLVNQAVAQAHAGLWKDASATISPTFVLATQVWRASWDAALIRLLAKARAEQAQSGAYPLLDNLFYGDYAAALDVLRAYKPAELFAQDTPVVSGTAAAGWESSLTNSITETVNPLIAAQADPQVGSPQTVAAAYFLRGWAVHLTDPGNPSVLADIERAAQLDPKEALFRDSVTYLKQ